MLKTTALSLTTCCWTTTSRNSLAHGGSSTELDTFPAKAGENNLTVHASNEMNVWNSAQPKKLKICLLRLPASVPIAVPVEQGL